jgi:glycosyltransferase involved in cell wall biosynthesis
MISTKKIAINATFTQDMPTGLGIYTHEVVTELLKYSYEVDFIVYSNSKKLKDSHPNRVRYVTGPISPDLGLKGHLMRILWQQTLPLKLRNQNTSLVYSTVPEGILFPYPNQIITIHDLIPIKYPELCPTLKYHYYYSLPLLLRNSRAVICDSENTKKDVLEFYKSYDKPIHVVPIGYDRKKFHPQERGIVRKKYGFMNYLLYVGDLRPYKNLERSIEAFGSLNLESFKFVIVGKKDPRFYPALQKKVEQLSLEEKVDFMGYVPEQDLASLYSEAAALVFPSLYEGFGLPLLEAMACGCPVITSNFSSMPEVCQEAAFYVDPLRIESIADGIRQVIGKPNLREILIKKGFDRVQSFSWERTAGEILKVLDQNSHLR